MLVAQSRLTLCDLMDCSLPGSSVHGILQAKILEWVAIHLSRGIFLTQGLNPGLPHCRHILYHLLLNKAQLIATFPSRVHCLHLIFTSTSIITAHPLTRCSCIPLTRILVSILAHPEILKSSPHVKALNSGLPWGISG